MEKAISFSTHVEKEMTCDYVERKPNPSNWQKQCCHTSDHWQEEKKNCPDEPSQYYLIVKNYKMVVILSHQMLVWCVSL